MPNQLFDELLIAVNAQTYLIGDSYMKHNTIHGNANVTIPSFKKPYQIYFELDPVDIGENFMSVDDYLTKVKEEIHDCIVFSLVYNFLVDQATDQLNELSKEYPDLVDKWLDDDVSNNLPEFEYLYPTPEIINR